jgi:hypothetical protein
MQIALKHSIHILITASLLFACTKEKKIPNEVVSNDPVFSVVGSIDGKNINLIAGEVSSYMYTYVFRNNSVDFYAGNLSNGGEEFIIKLADGNLDIPENDASLPDSNIAIAPNADSPLAVLNRSLFANEQEIDEILWTIDGIEQVGEEVSLLEPGKYEICADISFLDGTSGSTCNTYLIGFKRNGNGKINFTVNSGGIVAANISSSSAGNYEVSWYKNDEFITNNLTYQDNTPNTGPYILKARISFQNGAVMEREVWIDRSNTSNYIEDIGSIEEQNNLSWDHKAQIEITFDNEKYVAFDNSNSGSFEIAEVTFYNENEQGDEVYKVTGSLNTTFIRVSDQELVNGSFNVIFGIAK